jgi:hypothetical protein
MVTAPTCDKLSVEIMSPSCGYEAWHLYEMNCCRILVLDSTLQQHKRKPEQNTQPPASALAKQDIQPEAQAH